MVLMPRTVVIALVAAGAVISVPWRPALATEADALAVSGNIRALHMPFGTILNPIYASPSSNQIVGYTRCGDSSLWTGAYLAAESFRYGATQSPVALANVKAALAGLKSLLDVTGDNRLARCIVAADSPWAAGIQSEEASNTIHSNPPWLWVDNTSRDQVVGAFFGLGAAYDLVDDADVRSEASDTATRLIGFIARHQWSPNDDISNTFLLRPEQLQMLLQVARHINPTNTVSGPFLVPPVNVGVLVDVQSIRSYFKFNLDYMTLFHLVRLQNNDSNREVYVTLRSYTASHQNAFFDLVDRALSGPAAGRDQETRALVEQWLERPRRDFSVDLNGKVAVCGSEACQPVPVPLRPPGDFLWQDDPFSLSGGGSGFIETSGVDYILPYWMARYYGVISAGIVQSAAAPGIGVAPGSLATLYGTNLASGIAKAVSQPLPNTLGGASLAVIDAFGATRAAPPLYVSPNQINFLVPDGVAPGPTQFLVTHGSDSQALTANVGSVAPGLFSMNGAGKGVAAATAILTQAPNPSVQLPLPVFQCAASDCEAVPIRLGVDTPVYVTFYGTGIRNRSSLAKVCLTIHSISAPILYAGPTPGFSGLDQVNVALPLSLRGSGNSDVVLTVDGQSSNAVTIDVQ
jgi:uncharacterized protein (TIGR03437 family)